MATFIPKNARHILANAARTRDFFLKPYGLDVICRLASFQKIKISQNSTRNTNSFKKEVDEVWDVELLRDNINKYLEIELKLPDGFNKRKYADSLISNINPVILMLIKYL